MDMNELSRQVNHNVLKAFKDGVADALLVGVMAEDYSSAYRHGYEFGISIYCEMNKLDEEEEHETET